MIDFGKKAWKLGLVLALMLAQPVYATNAGAKAEDPDPTANPVLAGIVKTGAKLYYLGNRAGMDGWFIVKDGRVQIAYSTPDQKNVIVGALFGEDGQNITGIQVKNLFDNNKEISALLNNVAKEQEAITQTSPSAATPPVTNGGLPAVTLSPGERLVQELAQAAGVVVGNPSAPQIEMIMDPNCPFCQATWRALREAVLKNNLQIRMVPIANQDTDNERAAAILLHIADPLNAWDKYVGPEKGAGDKTQLAGTPDANYVAAVRANHALIDRWNITITPYFVYRGKDGKVKVLQGEPDKITTVLTDLGV